MKKQEITSLTYEQYLNNANPTHKKGFISIFKNQNKKTKKTINRKKIKIDLVFPYVDNSDAEWLAIYQQHMPKRDKSRWNNWALGVQRFRSYDLLKYTFRSIDKFVPFVNNVYLLVMQDSQVPDWIDRTKVKIIYHKDFIPAKYLPTFNSGTIEMFLQNIPGLSEYFIYGNDDIYFTSKINESDFFINKTPAYSITTRKRHNIPGDYLRYADKFLVTGKKPQRLDVIQHIWVPYLKSTIVESFNKYKKILLNNITPFRAKNNYNQWVFSLYQKYYKTFVNKEMKILCCEIYPETRYKYDVDWSQFKCICLNDSEKTTDEDISIVRNKLEKIFPQKSKYEL